MAKVSTSTAPASSATASSSILTATPNTHEAVVQIGLELGVVAITAVIAGTGAKATHAMVALWFLILVLLLVTPRAAAT
jgi:hypothetical protein